MVPARDPHRSANDPNQRLDQEIIKILRESIREVGDTLKGVEGRLDKRLDSVEEWLNEIRSHVGAGERTITQIQERDILQQRINQQYLDLYDNLQKKVTEAELARRTCQIEHGRGLTEEMGRVYEKLNRLDHQVVERLGGIEEAVKTLREQVPKIELHDRVISEIHGQWKLTLAIAGAVGLLASLAVTLLAGWWSRPPDVTTNRDKTELRSPAPSFPRSIHVGEDELNGTKR